MRSEIVKHVEIMRQGEAAHKHLMAVFKEQAELAFQAETAYDRCVFELDDFELDDEAQEITLTFAVIFGWQKGYQNLRLKVDKLLDTDFSAAISATMAKREKTRKIAEEEERQRELELLGKLKEKYKE